MYYDILKEAMQNNRGLVASELVNQILEGLAEPPKPDKKVALGALVGSILTGIALKAAGASMPTALAGAFETAGGVIAPEVKKMEQVKKERENIARAILEPVLKVDITEALSKRQEQENFNKIFEYFKSLGYSDEEARRIAETSILGLKEIPSSKPELEKRRQAYERLAKEIGIPAEILMENPSFIETYFREKLRAQQGGKAETINLNTLFKIYNEQDQTVKNIEKEIDKLILEAAKTKPIEGHLWWKHPSDWALKLKNRFENLREQYLQAQMEKARVGQMLNISTPLFDLKLMEAPNGALYITKVGWGEGGIDPQLAEKLKLVEKKSGEGEQKPVSAPKTQSAFAPSSLTYAHPLKEKAVEKSVDIIFEHVPLDTNKQTKSLAKQILKEVLTKNINPYFIWHDFIQHGDELKRKYPDIEWGKLIWWLDKYGRSIGVSIPSLDELEEWSKARRGQGNE